MWRSSFGNPGVESAKLERLWQAGQASVPAVAKQVANAVVPHVVGTFNFTPLVLVNLAEAMLMIGGCLAGGNPSFSSALQAANLEPVPGTGEYFGRHFEYGTEDRSLGWGSNAEQQRKRKRLSSIVRAKQWADGTVSEAVWALTKKGLAAVSIHFE